MRSGAIEAGDSLRTIHAVITLDKDSCSTAFVSRTTNGASMQLEIIILLLYIDAFVDALCLNTITLLVGTPLATHLMCGSLVTKVADAHRVDL